MSGLIAVFVFGPIFVCLGVVLGKLLVWVFEFLWKLYQLARERWVDPPFPPPGSLWMHVAEGHTWLSEGHDIGEKTPRCSGNFNIHFAPGSIWLVLGAGRTQDPDFFYVDVLQGSSTRPVRIMNNRCAMESHWGIADGKFRELRRIDADGG